MKEKELIPRREVRRIQRMKAKEHIPRRKVRVIRVHPLTTLAL